MTLKEFKQAADELAKPYDPDSDRVTVIAMVNDKTYYSITLWGSSSKKHVEARKHNP